MCVYRFWTVGEEVGTDLVSVISVHPDLIHGSWWHSYQTWIVFYQREEWSFTYVGQDPSSTLRHLTTDSHTENWVGLTDLSLGLRG